MIINSDYSYQRNKKLVLKEKNTIKQISLDRITHLTCDGYLTSVYTIDNKTITVSKLLKNFEIELIPYGFIRANHNALVNVNNIIEIQKGNKRYVVLSNKKEIKVSRRKLCLFKEIFNN